MSSLSAHPVLKTALPDGSVIAFRQSRAGDKKSGVGTTVLLHGIGSNSGSWAAQLQHGLNVGRVLAWDAPGYGEVGNVSTAVTPLRPSAQDYAVKLWQWLNVLGVGEVHLVGHSLGCIIAARAAAMQPQRVTQLTLLSPAQGYATATQADREAKRAQRLEVLNTLGPQGMADKRSSAMLSENATPQQREAVRQLMAQVNPAGYTQAVHLLMDADIGEDLKALQILPFGLSLSKPSSQVTSPSTGSGRTGVESIRIRVACGTADTITPPTQCQKLATQLNIPYTTIAGAGHAIAIEAPDAVNEFLSI